MSQTKAGIWSQGLMWLLVAVLGMAASRANFGAAAAAAAAPPRDGGWPEARRAFLEYLGQGGDPWEIPEAPRIVLISELGAEGGGVGGTSGGIGGGGGVGQLPAGEDDESLLMNKPDDDLAQSKRKRESDAGPSLSVVNHLDVLRQKLLLEMARRRMQKSQSQIIANQNLLRQIGKRSVDEPQERRHL
ncbi:unnamed protein product [Notodromas monacha]|uniref:Corticotropin-releasing factor domain-containing protein n=1 Tax=Notodromas monacha TaxID=399045 RepID=A0A7R9GGF4_9CRUS|nr:unnamed protein product [Notodromas monacha]CAG0920138.1 unnamed protein product [Notodromas monacha]